MIELVHDLLARLANEELGVLEDRGVHLFEGELSGDGAEVAEKPVANAQIFRVEVARPTRRLQLLGAHGSLGNTPRGRLPRGARDQDITGPV